jgi:uncharacterized membrane protein YeaQ/YmgE (transglycosylase-associated protein family)
MQILSAIIIGGIVGVLAKLFMPGKDPGGIIVTILLGIAGGVAAGFLGRMVGLYQPGASAPGFIASVLGAMILLGAYRLLVRRRAV